MPHKKGAPADWRAELWARLCDVDICAEAFGSDDFIMTKDGPVLLRDQARLDAETHANLTAMATSYVDSILSQAAERLFPYGWGVASHRGVSSRL
jgi:hypothetical protein